MNKTDKIFIAGAGGMVGSALIRKLLDDGFENIIGSVHKRRLNDKESKKVRLIPLDLIDQNTVNHFFETEKPDHVFLAAARVGGIHANNTYPAQFIYENLMIQNNIIHAAYANSAQRLLFLGSSCIYPKECPQPMKEEHLLTGFLEPTNEPYAVAKIAGIKTCESYNRQYGTRFVAVMPTNLYGPNDNFDLETSHVMPALIRKFHEAKVSEQKEVIVWGTGTPRREFLHVDDMADASVFVMNLPDADLETHLLNYPQPCFVNVGSGTDGTIAELANIIKEQVGFEGALRFDTSKPDGTMKKLLDVSSLEKMGWKYKIPLEQGVRHSYEWFLEHQNK